MVQNVLQWMKDNIVVVLCIVVALLSIGSFFWPTSAKGNELVASMESQNSTIQQLKSYQSRSVQIPPENPDNPNTRIDMPVTPPAIEALKKLYNDLDREFKGIYRLAHDRNRAGHEPMLDGLFPAPVDLAKPFDAPKAYVQAFHTLHAALNAGGPPTAEELKEAMDREETRLRRAFLLTPEAKLTESQERDLKKKQAERMIELYKRAAGRIHMYATEPVLTFQEWKPGAFQVGAWARSSRPLMPQIWEGQMQLWIQQDLVQALRIANETTNEATSVTRQPVKRLLAMYVEPGYVGIAGTSEESGVRPGEAPARPTRSSSREEAKEAAPADPAAELQAYQEKLGARLPNNFVASPTGRQSNVIYDVRHAVLSVIVDSKQIPKLLNALGQVNYMTVFSMTITDVDDYKELASGYYYGSGVDAVRLDLKIETIWLRSWTAGDVNAMQAQQAVPPRPFNPGLMPNEVRVALGLPLRTGTAPGIGNAPSAGPETPAPGAPADPDAADRPATPEAPAAPGAPGIPGTPGV